MFNVNNFLGNKIRFHTWDFSLGLSTIVQYTVFVSMYFCPMLGRPPRSRVNKPCSQPSEVLFDTCTTVTGLLQRIIHIFPHASILIIELIFFHNNFLEDPFSSTINGLLFNNEYTIFFINLLPFWHIPHAVFHQIVLRGASFTLMVRSIIVSSCPCDRRRLCLQGEYWLFLFPNSVLRSFEQFW